MKSSDDIYKIANPRNIRVDFAEAKTIEKWRNNIEGSSTRTCMPFLKRSRDYAGRGT